MELQKNKLIYMASPYTHENKKIVEYRFDEVCRATAGLMKEGYFIFSPIAHTHPLVKYDIPGYWEYWADYDRKFLTACDMLCVLMLDGWKESVGVQAEIKIAEELEKPICYLEHKIDFEKHDALYESIMKGKNENNV